MDSSVNALFAESESFVLLSFYVQKTTGGAMNAAAGGTLGRGASGRMKTARERVERKPRVLVVTAKREKSKMREFAFKVHDVKYSGDKGALALSIRDTWRLHNLASISVSDPGTSYSSAGGAAGGMASKEANKLVVMTFEEQRTTLKSISVTGPRGASGTQFLLTSGDEHLKIIWFLRFLNSKYLLRDIEVTGVANAELEQWYRTNVQLVHETFESSGFGFERRKLPKVDSADQNQASVEANKSLMISEEEAMLQEMFETYNVEFRDTDMVDFLKEKLSLLEAENVEDIFGSERRVQDCVDKMEVASSTLDDLRCYMDSIHVKLQHMRKDIRAIDMQNYVFNIQRRNNKSILDELEKIFDKGEVKQEVITALEKGTLEPPNWNDTLDAIGSLTETIEYVNSKITELEKTRGIKDLSTQLAALRARFINRAVPALCTTFRAFIDEYGKGLRDRSHHKVHRRLLIYSPLVTKLRRLDRGSSERAGGAFCTKMHSQLIAEGRACMSEIAQSDTTKHLSSCVHFVLWLCRFVPHMTKELEFTLCFFLTDEKPGSGKPLKIASSDEEVADTLVMSLFKSFEDTIRRISTSALRDVRNDASLSSMIMMQAHVSAWRSFFRRKEYCRVLEFMFGALAAELEEKVEARSRDSGAASRSSGGGGAVKGMHLLPVVENTALVLADMARSADIEAVEKIFRDQGGATSGGGGGSAEEIVVVMNEARTLCKATSNRVVDSLGPPLLASLQRLASSDKKHGDRLLIENLDFIHSAIRRARPKSEKRLSGTSSSDSTKTIASLEKLMDNASELYKSCLSRYVLDQMRYHIEPVLSFLELLERTMPVMDRHEIGYQRGCTRTDLRKALSTSFNPSVERVLTNIKHRIAKHFSSSSASGDGSAAGFEGGVDVKGTVAYKVWSETQKSLLQVMLRLEKIVAVVFAEEKLNPSVHEIKELLKAI